MKKHLYFKMLLFLVVIFLTDCKKEYEDPYTISEKDKKEIIDSYTEIANQTNQLLSDGAEINDLKNYLQDFKSQPGVEDVWITNSSLFVKFTKGGVVSWIVPTDILTSSKNIESLPYIKTNNKSIIGNNKVCLINQQYYDESNNRKTICRNIIDSLKTSFNDKNFEITVKNGINVDLNFISQELNNYGIIYYISHGAYDGIHTWICSGEESDSGLLTLSEILLEKYFPSWKDEEISLAGIGEIRNGQFKHISYLCFSEKYVENVYSNESFDNSIVYLVACQSFKETNLAEAFVSKGVGVVIGWDELNCIGQSTGQSLLELMLEGATVGEAINSLPIESKYDECSVTPGANLVFYPTNAENIVIIDDETSIPIVTTASVTVTSSTSATSGGTIVSNGGYEIIHKGVCWSMSSNPTIANDHTDDGSGSVAFGSIINGLMSNTTYHLRAYATNSTGTGYGAEIEFTTFGNSNFGTVYNPITGRTWMDRNLGASQVATSITDENAYGDLYQWGRLKDGHESRTSGTIVSLSSTDVPGHSSYIIPSSGYDWRSPHNDNLWQGESGVNNPCPSGFRLPTEAEWVAEQNTWSSNDAEGAYNSVLKLTTGGYREQSDGSLKQVGSWGKYWSSDVSGVNSRNLIILNSVATMGGDYRAVGASVRCILD